MLPNENKGERQKMRKRNGEIEERTRIYETEGESRGSEEIFGARIRRTRRRIVVVAVAVIRHVDDAHGSSSHLVSKWVCFMGIICF